MQAAAIARGHSPPQGARGCATLRNLVNLEPGQTGLAVFQVPGLGHFIGAKEIDSAGWQAWSEFAVKMILAFSRNHPPSPQLPARQ